jgi:uncharacterized protein (DUF1015 family)
LLCGASIEEYERGLIRKRDFTGEGAVVDERVEPVIMVHSPSEAIHHLINETEARVEPLIDATGEDGVRHLLWRAKNTVALQRVFAGIDVLYIADGYRLCEHALRMRERGGDASDFFLALICPDDGVCVRPVPFVSEPGSGLFVYVL